MPGALLLRHQPSDRAVLVDQIMGGDLRRGIAQPVERSRRALHAGIVQHDHGDRQRPLVAEIKARYGITRGDVVGHSDVAPARKQDPGELFNWHALARLRLALPRPTKNLMDPGWPDAGFIMALERFGYDVSDEQAAVIAFQRRFRPEMIDGEIDMECRCLLLALLLPKPQGDE